MAAGAIGREVEAAELAEKLGVQVGKPVFGEDLARGEVAEADSGVADGRYEQQERGPARPERPAQHQVGPRR